jgi:hypothetical protein
MTLLLLFGISAVVFWTVIVPAGEDLRRVLVGGLAVLLFLALAVAIWLARPFLVKDGFVYLTKPVRTASGRRQLRIPLAEIDEASLVTAPEGKVEIWVTLRDGTHFHVITLATEEGRKFAHQFVDYFDGEVLG